MVGAVSYGTCCVSAFSPDWHRGGSRGRFRLLDGSVCESIHAQRGASGVESPVWCRQPRCVSASSHTSRPDASTGGPIR